MQGVHAALYTTLCARKGQDEVAGGARVTYRHCFSSTRLYSSLSLPPEWNGKNEKQGELFYSPVSSPAGVAIAGMRLVEVNAPRALSA